MVSENICYPALIRLLRLSPSGYYRIQMKTQTLKNRVLPIRAASFCSSFFTISNRSLTGRCERAGSSICIGYSAATLLIIMKLYKVIYFFFVRFHRTPLLFSIFVYPRYTYSVCRRYITTVYPKKTIHFIHSIIYHFLQKSSKFAVYRF